jgi:hypothetical protein
VNSFFVGSDNIIDIRQLHDEGSFTFARDFDFSDLSLDSRNFKVFEASVEVEIRDINLKRVAGDPQWKDKYP